MNLTDVSQVLGNFGEFVGAIGVVATLAYLAVQIRQNTRETQSASHHAITDSINQGNIAIAQDAELAQIWMAGCTDRGSLTDVERERSMASAELTSTSLIRCSTRPTLVRESEACCSPRKRASRT